MKTKIILAAFIAACLLAACSGNDVDTPTVAKPNFTVEEINTADQLADFGMEFFQTVCKDTPEGNVVMSPIGASIVLSMLANTVDESTSNQISDVLGFSNVSTANALFQKYMSWLPNADNNVQLYLSNSVWYNENYTLSPEFSAIAQQYYSSPAFARDFDQNSTSTVNEINRWVSSKTNGNINSILENLTPKNYFVMINALNFKGNWSSPFDASKTNDESFYGYHGNHRVPMMKKEHSYSYTETNDFQIVELPFGNRTFTTWVVLPSSKWNIDEFIGSDSFRSILHNPMVTCNVDLTFPKFKIEPQDKLDLREALSNMGISNINKFQSLGLFLENVNTYLDIFQKTSIEFDETGAKASSVSVATGGDIFTPPPSGRVEMIVNRPFVFIIKESTTKTPLFVGRVTNI